MSDQQNLIRRFRKWVIWALAAGVLLYVGGSVWAGFQDMGAELSSFAWWIYGPVLLLTLGNYGLRFFKWHYLLRVLGVRIPIGENARIFTAGLAMVISPGKAGEYYHRAVRLYREGELREALIWARVALQHDPSHDRARKLKHELEEKGVTVIDD